MENRSEMIRSLQFAKLRIVSKPVNINIQPVAGNSCRHKNYEFNHGRITR